MAWVTIDVDIEEFDDDDLIEELNRRGYVVSEDEEQEKDVPEQRTKIPSSYSIGRDFDRHKLRTHLENITDCGSYVSNEYILEILKYLLEN